jgi:hypothetical protein
LFSSLVASATRSFWLPTIVAVALLRNTNRTINEAEQKGELEIDHIKSYRTEVWDIMREDCFFFHPCII